MSIVQLLRRGTVYTPRWLADAMAGWMLADDAARNSEAASASSAVWLDPACGDGEFLLAVAHCLEQRENASGRQVRTGKVPGQPISIPDDIAEFPTPECANTLADHSRQRLSIIREHLFGMDVDRPALDRARERLLDWIAPPAPLRSQVIDLLHSQIACGDSLAEQSPWSDRSFDHIIGNPPYIREKDAKPLFDALAETPLGQKWREPRMDLWYYFAHRALDLLRPGGQLSFVVPAYWISSRGARRLIDRLERETSLLQLVWLDDLPVFPGVQGRHVVFRLRRHGNLAATDAGTGNTLRACTHKIGIHTKGLPTVFRPPHDIPCEVWLPNPNVPDEVVMSDLAETQPGNPPESWQGIFVPQAELIVGSRILLAEFASVGEERRSAVVAPQSLETLYPMTLGELAEIRQGIAENPPRIARRHVSLAPAGTYRLGEGVFVLRSDEIDRLILSPPEAALLRPYYEARRFGRYRLPGEPAQWLLYLTRHTAPDLAEFPAVERHLARFRPLLERRREVCNGGISWWHLHWPREERLFVEPRILSIQMGRIPQFVYAEQPTFVGFSVNVISGRGLLNGWTLPALCAWLNSPRLAEWFTRHAKRRGVGLEINGHLLRSVPLPPLSLPEIQRLDRLVRERQAAEFSADPVASCETLERQISEVLDSVPSR